MSTASARALPFTPTNTFGSWLEKSLRSVRSASRPVAPRPRPANHQEAEKLRALARDMMRIDAGSAADLFAAAERHEFGYNKRG